jgi:hypothetical protein
VESVFDRLLEGEVHRPNSTQEAKDFQMQNTEADYSTTTEVDSVFPVELVRQLRSMINNDRGRRKDLLAVASSVSPCFAPSILEKKIFEDLYRSLLIAYHVTAL